VSDDAGADGHAVFLDADAVELVAVVGVVPLGELGVGESVEVAVAGDGAPRARVELF
jgi:hypothetical protein